jgi:hypothetical protein
VAQLAANTDEHLEDYAGFDHCENEVASLAADTDEYLEVYTEIDRVESAL